MSNTRVQIAGVELKNPVMTASGTFGSGEEFSEYVNLNQLGAVVTKGVANVPWPGNPVPRVTETASGMLNAIGLQNPGIDVFCQRDIPFLRQFDTRIVVNVCGRSVRDYCEVAERLADEPVDLLEINVSCPNVKEGGIAFGQDPAALENITKEVKRFARQPIILKLSPNVTDITVMAKAAEAGGADAISLINTLTGMKIDIYRRTFALANRTGGLSGPAIKPVALRMVWQAAHAVSLPVIGMGGISSAEDAVEFLMAGATAVSVGTANFHDPSVTEKIVSGIEDFMQKQKIHDISEITGKPMHLDIRLTEQCFGKYEATARDGEEFARAKMDFADRYGDGESMLHLAQRIYNLLDDIREDTEKTYLLVAHNGIARVIESYFRPMTNQVYASFGVKNCAILTYEWGDSTE